MKAVRAPAKRPTFTARLDVGLTGVRRRRASAAPTKQALVASQRLQRAIGVIYRLDTERQSHYFPTRLAQQFDAVIHIDETSAVEPLDVGQVWSDGEAPETFPSGIYLNP